MKHPRLTIGLSALGAVLLGLYLTRGEEPLSVPPGSGPPAGPLPGGPLPTGTTGLTSYLSDAFFRGLEELAVYFRSRGANVTAEELMGVFFVESAGINAKAVNPRSGCLGLNQICPTLAAFNKGVPLDPERVSGLRAVGFQGTRAEYMALSEEAQLPFVKKFFDTKNAYRAIQDYGTLYLVNFSPAFLAPPSSGAPWYGRYPIMYRDPAQGGTAPLDKNYTDNAGIDNNPKKGYIEVADMAKFVKNAISSKGNLPKWNELRFRLKNALPPPANV